MNEQFINQLELAFLQYDTIDMDKRDVKISGQYIGYIGCINNKENKLISFVIPFCLVDDRDFFELKDRVGKLTCDSIVIALVQHFIVYS